MSDSSAPTNRTKVLVILIGVLALAAAIIAVILLSIPPKPAPAATLPTSDMLTGTYDWGEFGGEVPSAPVVSVDDNGCFTTRGSADASPSPMLIIWPAGSELSGDFVVAGETKFGNGSELPYTVVAVSRSQAIEASEHNGDDMERMLHECGFDGADALVGILHEPLDG
jgi:hypothetical protein